MAEVSRDVSNYAVTMDDRELLALRRENDSLRALVRALEDALRHRPGGCVLIHSQDAPHVDRVNVYARLQIDAGNGATAFLDEQTVRQACAVLGVELAHPGRPFLAHLSDPL